MERRKKLLLAAPALAAGLALAPAGAALAATSASGASANARGSNEVGKAGDPTATATAWLSFNTSTNRLCYTVTATSLNAVAMHIHKGAAGTNGPVVVPLDPAKIGAGKTCLSVAPALLGDIAANPASYYFNAHTKAFPAGAIRGQLVAMPTGVSAGNGGQAAGGTGTLPVALLLVGGAVVGTAGVRLIRH